MIAGYPVPGYKLRRFTERAESLIIEVIRNPVSGHFLDGPLGADKLGSSHGPQHDVKSVGDNIARGEWAGRLAEVLELQTSLAEAAFGAAVDRDMLHRDGVSVFQAAVRDLVPGKFPPPRDRFHCLWRSESAFRQTVQGERARAVRRELGNFLDSEVLGDAFEFHEFKYGEKSILPK